MGPRYQIILNSLDGRNEARQYLTVSGDNCRLHWRRLVKNIGWENQNIGGQKVVKSDKCMGVAQLLVTRARAPPPQSLRLWSAASIVNLIFAEYTGLLSRR